MLAEELQRGQTRGLRRVGTAGAHQALVPSVPDAVAVARQTLPAQLQLERPLRVERADEREHRDAPMPEPA